MTVSETDVPAGLLFVDPNEQTAHWTVCLWAASGEGKTVGACSAPGPIVALSADRKGAYRFARAHYPGKDIRESRFVNGQSLADLYRYLKSTPDVETVIIDPVKAIYDRLVDEAPLRGGDPDWQGVNKKMLGFLHSLREFDVNVVLIAHEKLNDGKKGDGKLYPELGGPSLINNITKEMDIVAHVERDQTDDGARWMAQLAPTPHLVCKDSTPGGLGERRPLDLTEWFAAGAAPPPDTSDVPWDDDFEAGKETLGDVTEDD